jgi:hypothetical protein
MRKYLALILLVVSGPLWGIHASAHELTPTYPKLEQSYIPNVLQTKVKIWNARVDVNHYKLEVTDAFWNDVPFIADEKLFKLDYMERREIEIFLPSDTTAQYICTRSMLQKGSQSRSMISSKVCSKIR